MNREDSIIPRIARDVLDGRTASRSELLDCARLAGGAAGHYELLHHANLIRVKHFANTVRLCSIGAGKIGACSEDCKWCAQSAAFSPGRTQAKLAAKGYLSAAAGIAQANQASSFGIVNSGLKPGESDFQAVLDATAEIKQNVGCDMRLCASLGTLTPAQAANLVAAGVTRFSSIE